MALAGHPRPVVQRRSTSTSVPSRSRNARKRWEANFGGLKASWKWTFLHEENRVSPGESRVLSSQTRWWNWWKLAIEVLRSAALAGLADLLPTHGRALVFVSWMRVCYIWNSISNRGDSTNSKQNRWLMHVDEWKIVQKPLPCAFVGKSPNETMQDIAGHGQISEQNWVVYGLIMGGAIQDQVATGDSCSLINLWVPRMIYRTSDDPSNRHLCRYS